MRPNGRPISPDRSLPRPCRFRCRLLLPPWLAVLAVVWFGSAASAAPPPPPPPPAPPAKAVKAVEQPAPVPGTPACPRGELVARGKVTGRHVSGHVPAVLDGALVQEGEGYDKQRGTIFYDRNNGRLEVDLGGPRDVGFLVLQGDANDHYVVEGSEDGKAYRTLWHTARFDDKFGQRTRSIALPNPSRARYLRIRGKGGDGAFIVSELRVYCEKPEPFPPKLKRPPPKTWWQRIDSPLMISIKGLIAGAAVLLLVLGFVYRWPYRPLRQRSWLEIALVIGALAGVLWTGYTGRLRGMQIGGGLALTWLVLRWMTGDAPRPRGRFGKLGAAAVGPTGVGVLAAIAIVSTAAVLRFTPHRALLWACGTATAWLGLFVWLKTLSRPISFANTARGCLAGLGLFGLVAWWNLGHFHYDHYVHIWEHYHYFIGSKYGPELRYSRIYECTAVADMSDGRRQQVEKRPMRQLDTDNSLGTTEAILKDPGRCKRHFNVERFRDFRKDIRFFRGRFSKERWDRSQTDHGYNATPVWAISARLITDAVGDLSWQKIERLAAIDSVLLLAMWLAVLWAFGWQAACVALIYWGCNYPARFYWNGGAFLRFDWLFFMTLGVCLLRKRWHFGAGAALTVATGLRVFPGFLVAALILKAITRMIRHRRLYLSRQHASFAAGCITAIALLVPASSWATDGLDAWPQFLHNSQKHLETALTNNMGLKTVLGYDYATRASAMRNPELHDPFSEWKAARKHFYTARTPVFLALVALFVVMLARATAREDDWMAACLGIGLAPIAMELTCYYYGFLLLYGLMWERRKLPGILAVALAAVTYPLSLLDWNDDRFAAMSLAAVIVVVAVTAHAAFGSRRAYLDEELDEAEDLDAPDASSEGPDKLDDGVAA